MRIMLIMLAFVGLSACTETGRAAEDAVKLSEDNWFKLQRQLWELVEYRPAETPAHLPAMRYCYKATSDIVCYLRPQPHLSAKLYGYQGPPPEAFDSAMLSYEQGREPEVAVADEFVIVRDLPAPGAFEAQESPEKLLPQY